MSRGAGKSQRGKRGNQAEALSFSAQRHNAWESVCDPAIDPETREALLVGAEQAAFLLQERICRLKTHGRSRSILAAAIMKKTS